MAGFHLMLSVTTNRVALILAGLVPMAENPRHEDYEFVWDEAKNGTNIRKHGFALRMPKKCSAEFCSPILTCARTTAKSAGLGLAQLEALLPLSHLRSLHQSFCESSH